MSQWITTRRLPCCRSMVPGGDLRDSAVHLGCESRGPTTAARNSASSSVVAGRGDPRIIGDGTQTGQAGRWEAGAEIEGDRMTKFAPVVMSKQTESSPFRFAEIAREAGIDFVHFSGMTEEKHFPTANGSGVAVFDYDNDGLLDIYFATATLLPLGTAEKGPNRLYKNLGNDRFQDETEKSGLGYRGFCHGIIAGDIDNDGDVDVFLCNYGTNVLYLNNGDGTFKDISKSAGIDAPNWSSSGAMLDYDNDGYLDIYVTNYGIWNYPDDHHLVGRRPEEGLALRVAPHDQDDQAPLLPQQPQRDVHERLRQGDHRREGRERPQDGERGRRTPRPVRWPRSGCPIPATTATASASWRPTSTTTG